MDNHRELVTHGQLVRDEAVREPRHAISSILRSDLLDIHCACTDFHQRRWLGSRSLKPLHDLHRHRRVPRLILGHGPDDLRQGLAARRRRRGAGLAAERAQRAAEEAEGRAALAQEALLDCSRAHGRLVALHLDGVLREVELHARRALSGVVGDGRGFGVGAEQSQRDVRVQKLLFLRPDGAPQQPRWRPHDEQLQAELREGAHGGVLCEASRIPVLTLRGVGGR
mmetsp:Transcript_106578/g.286786  ORF Transcript_106578/g.286786 Transcript_106578/m.286786 type:complete len:225 (-) Transcript_106578:860-1534(-)